MTPPNSSVGREQEGRMEERQLATLPNLLSKELWNASRRIVE